MRQQLSLNDLRGYMVVDSQYKYVVSIEATREDARNFKRDYVAWNGGELERFKIYGLKQQKFVR